MYIHSGNSYNSLSLREFTNFCTVASNRCAAKSSRSKRLCKRTYSCTDECDHACVNDSEV